MIRYSSQIFLWLLLPFGAWSQDFSPFSAPVLQDGEWMNHAWIGGLNAPQVSQIDLNRDGFLDLHIFDRKGNVQLTFLHSGQAGSVQYQYAPEYLDAFPEISNWMLLRDYNSDGIPDIFCYSDIPGIDGLIAYTGAYQGNQLKFERYEFGPPFNLASFPSNNGNLLPLYISRIDYPGIADVDCDGDLDVLTFNISGGYIEWYRNTSVEKGHSLDRLEFVLEEGCWGGFYESGITSLVNLASKPGQCFTPENGAIAVNYRHAGSTLMLFDPDEDGDQDLVLGDLSFNNLNYLNNGGDCEQAWMNKQNIQFPTTEFPVDLPTFPTSFYLDINQDGQEDLLAAPNSLQNIEDQEVLWYYRGDRDANGNKQFRFQQKDFLIEKMLDLGTNAFPAFFDYNLDGVMDLVVGNQSRFTSEGTINSSLFLFENSGTNENPQFELIDEDYLNMEQFNPTSYGFRPAFGDLDGDGDQDILVGETFGYLYFGENIAGPGAPPEFAPLVFQYMDIDVGLNSAPAIVDVNQDGLMDILIGERQGNINYFENIGTPGNPQFIADMNAGGTINRLGEISTRAPGFLVGNSMPQVFYQQEKAYLILGGEQGNLLLYESDNKRLDGTLSLIDEQVANQRSGRGSSVALADLDQDGFLEMVIGNGRGGMQLRNTPFSSDLTVSTRAPSFSDFSFELFPNPAPQWVNIRIEGASDQYLLEVRQLDGKIIQRQILQQKQTRLPVSHWPAGVYIIQLRNQQRNIVRRLVKL